MKKHRIVFVIHALNIGGAERIVVSLMNHLSRDHYEIHLVVFDASGAFFQELASDIVVHNLGVRSATRGLLPLFRTLHRLEPDTVFAGIGYLNALLSVGIVWFNRLAKKPIRWVARETSIVSRIIQQERFTFIFEWLYRHHYHRFDRIICQSNYMKTDLSAHYGLDPKKMVVIHNPVDGARIEAMAQMPLSYRFDPNKVNLLAVGALRPVKQFDHLIEALSHLDDRYHLTLVGDGVEAPRLKSLTQTLGLEDRVTFEGHQLNPYPYMKSADVLLLSSAYEGFPNVVLEANYLGLPVIAYGAVGGIIEIVQSGITGELVASNPLALVEAIEAFDKDQYHPHRLREITFKRFGIQRIMRAYEAVLS